jgi:hypothetical protein
MGIFDDPEYNSKRYGTSTRRGSPERWRSAYEEVMGEAEAAEILDESDAYTGGRRMKSFVILEIDITTFTLTEELVKTAYRKMVFKVHPDHGGTAEAFKVVHAAYSHLMADIG